MPHMTLEELESLTRGDKVTVRTYEDMLLEHGEDFTGCPDVKCGFVNEMREFCGKKVTISAIGYYGAYPYALIEEDEMCYLWSYETLEALSRERINEEELQKQYMEMFWGGA